MTPWRLAYWPVRIEARFGEQIGVVWKARSNRAPSRASRSMCGVFMYGWPPAPKRRSSIRMTRKFGLVRTRARGLDERHPLRQVVGDRLGERRRRGRRRDLEALLVERREHLRPGERGIDLAIQALDHRRRN